MNVRCSQCRTLYRVDPRRVPPGGIRARCSRCSHEFRVRRERTDAATPDQRGSDAAAGAATSADVAAAAPPAPPTDAGSVPADDATAAPADASGPPTTARPSAATGPTADADGAAHAADEDAPTAAPASTSAGGESAPSPGDATAPVFGASDPDTRARRIARALVSDIVAYHGERRDESLANGTLKEDFEDEITKSWEEYVEQVGTERAESTTHFRDALNDILARGEPVF